MFGITPLGWVHTLGSLPAIPLAAYMFARHGRIMPRTAPGIAYLIFMLIGAGTVFLVAHQSVSYGIGTVTILLLIAGMVVVGTAIEVTGLAAAGAERLIDVISPMGPFGALVVLYGVTLFATELLSNATVAVLITPIAVALAESLGVDPRPFLVGVMMAASAAFATPFGYQTNVLVFNMGGYSYMDFVRVGLPLNLATWVAAMVAIPIVFPF